MSKKSFFFNQNLDAGGSKRQFDRVFRIFTIIAFLIAMLGMAPNSAQAAEPNGGYKTCYRLTIGHTGEGSDPTASPSKSWGCYKKGYYVAGEHITLSGAVPAEGWRIASWTGTKNDSSTASSNTVKMPAKAHTALVNYTKDEYILTVLTVGSGSTTVTPPGPYAFGTVVDVTASAAPGFVFDFWSGACTGSGACQVIMDADKTVTAHFSESSANQFTITASAGANGSISPSGAVIVAQGGSQAFSMLPDAGYQVADVLVDGVSAGPVTNYAFNDVQANHSISVSFETIANRPPVITEGEQIGTTVSKNAYPNKFSLTLNATDPDGDPITWVLLSQASNGTAAVSGTGNSQPIAYKPKLNYGGMDSFVVQVSDGQGGTDTIIVNVTVSGGGDFPTFVDVPIDHPYWAFAEALYYYGFTGGCGTNPLRYCPDLPLIRSQAAILLLRGMYGSSYTPPPATGTVFADVTVTTHAAAWIEALVAEGITGGCGGGNYCPNSSVTRGQAAVLLLRAKYGSDYVPPAVGASTGFADVPTSHPLAAWIKQLAAEGISTGCGGGNFCPNSALSREQAALMFQRTFVLDVPEMPTP
ncbi:MAG: S-layer homology domain-containing protein [Anaerolineales bacterium]|nr:S-layer homology domain-containing protein [Anaerolineales bacterium]